MCPRLCCVLEWVALSIIIKKGDGAFVGAIVQGMSEIDTYLDHPR